MKKYKAEIYAQVLFQLVQETDSLEDALSNFINLVVKYNQLSIFDEIIIKFTRLYNQQKNELDVNIQTAFRLDSKQLADIELLINRIKKVDQVNLKQEVNKKLIGGLKINFEDYQLDATIKNSLNKFKSAS